MCVASVLWQGMLVQCARMHLVEIIMVVRLGEQLPPVTSELHEPAQRSDYT